MTTIAYRDGVMAGDSLVTSDGIRMGEQAKVASRADGAVCGACGASALIAAILQWFAKGAPGDHHPKFGENDAQALIVMPDGAVFWFDYLGIHDLKSPFAAIGSGRDIAIGAMAAGASATEAVNIAIRYDSHSGGEVRVVKVMPA